MQNENDTDELRSALAQLQFLKGSLRQLFAWPLLCVGIGILVWVFAISHLASSKDRIAAQALDDAASLAVAYAEQLVRTVAQLDQTTLTLAHYWQQSNGQLRLEDQAGQGLYPDIAGFSVSIFDSKGKLLTSLRENQGSGDIADRAHFQAHREQRVSGLQVTRLEKSRISGLPAVVFSRALTDKTGRFDGLVSVTVPPDFLESFYEKAAEGENSALALLTTSGDAIVSRMGKNLRSQKALVNGAVVFPVRRGTMVAPAERFNDGRRRCF